MNTIVRLVEAGLGISIVPTSVANGHDLKVKFVPLEDSLEHTEVAIAYQVTEERSIVTQFLKLLPSGKGSEVV